MTFIGLLLVVVQLRAGTKQREAESLVQIYDINRQLLTLGFSDTRLFDILNDAKNADPILERFYLQLWFNQLALIHTYLERSFIGGELWESLERDIADFLVQSNMRRHWAERGIFYPASFQKLVNDILEKAEPPVTAQAASGI